MEILAITAATMIFYWIISIRQFLENYNENTRRYLDDLKKLQKLTSSAQKNKQKIDADADNVRRYFY